MDLALRDKVAFVAGGSRGIGFAIAQAFAAEGAKVAIAARNKDALDEACWQLEQAAGASRIVTIQGDMTSDADIRAAVDETERRLGRIDAAVANVGTGAAKLGYELDRAEWLRALDANLLGAGLLAGAVLPRLVSSGGGSLTFVSSIAGIEAINAPVPYSAAKAGLMMAMKSYARQVGSSGVRVNVVAPGNVLFPGGSWSKKLEEAGKEAVFTECIQREVALQRFATPKEIADVVVFIASERASFLTGSVVVVDGGQTRSF